MTNVILLWQKFCRGKRTFVVTKDVFCRDKHVCCDKDVFVVTEIILVAAPTNDSILAKSRHRFNAQGHLRLTDLHNYIYSLSCCPTDHTLTTHQHPQWHSFTELFQTSGYHKWTLYPRGSVRLRKSAPFVFNAWHTDGQKERLYLNSLLVLTLAARTLIIIGVERLSVTGFDVRESWGVIQWFTLPGFCQQSRQSMRT